MGLDYGEKRIGIAVSDPSAMIAAPSGFIARRRGKRVPVNEIVVRARELGVREFVLGLPLDGEGNETERTGEVRMLAQELEKRTGLPTRLVDERFTTATALRAVREMGGTTRGRKGDVDSLAAAVLLQYALDSARRGSQP
ncbi:MAG: Holliday junction resolvase RuvX [Gemmatimonadaceae bacterium]|nr:Holliday junction resolvase RuvX [Gemmatimonadaceae bacterium]